MIFRSNTLRNPFLVTRQIIVCEKLNHFAASGTPSNIGHTGSMNAAYSFSAGEQLHLLFETHSRRIDNAPASVLKEVEDSLFVNHVTGAARTPNEKLPGRCGRLACEGKESGPQKLNGVRTVAGDHGGL